VVESGSWDALTADRGGSFHALWSEQAAHVSRSPAEQRPVVISWTCVGAPQNSC
jgi:hypothetical protein